MEELSERVVANMVVVGSRVMVAILAPMIVLVTVCGMMGGGIENGAYQERPIVAPMTAEHKPTQHPVRKSMLATSGLNSPPG